MSSCGSCGTSDGGTPKGCQSHGTCGTSGCNKLSVFDWLSNINTSNSEENNLVEIRFKNDRKGFFLNYSKLPIHIGEVVSVEGNPGHDVGTVSLTGALVQIQFKKKKQNLEDVKKIYRISNQKDIDTWKEYREKENPYMIEARKIAHGLKLNMKICDVEFQADGSKATFYYTAEGRVDFRELIKQFATNFRTKIDMRQIGYRQESAKIGGIGSCGRELCCSSWLTDFRSVNTAAARYQQLSINPQKLAGQCGKLKCCLNYELDSYLEAINDFPSQQTVLNTVKGKAQCLKIDVFRKKMWFVYSDNFMNWFSFDVNEVKELIEINKKGEAIIALEELQKNEFESKPVDLIQENNLNRFETKNKSKNKRNRNQNQKKEPIAKVENQSVKDIIPNQKKVFVKNNDNTNVKKVNPNQKNIKSNTEPKVNPPTGPKKVIKKNINPNDNSEK